MNVAILDRDFEWLERHVRPIKATSILSAIGDIVMMPWRLYSVYRMSIKVLVEMEGHSRPEELTGDVEKFLFKWRETRDKLADAKYPAFFIKWADAVCDRAENLLENIAIAKDGGIQRMARELHDKITRQHAGVH